MGLSTINEWLDWIASIHSTEIELGLDRIKKVAERLGDLAPACAVVTVGGTNGKGSVVAGLESIYRAAGYHVGAFTSPYLFKHNEYVRIDQQIASDDAFIAAYQKIEKVRGQISLTPFEFHTLAALLIFKQAPLDILIMEVGMGGRLDAVNILESDIAIVTSIDLDHTEFLGKTREAIGFEKSGIFRQNKPAIIGDFNPPESIAKQAAALGSLLLRQGKEFNYQENPENWKWVTEDLQYDELPYCSLATQNMAIVLMAITTLQKRLPISSEAIKKGLATVQLPGRIQILNEPVIKIFDVAHNPAAVSWLTKKLQSMPTIGKTRAVFSMLSDKDIASSVHCISSIVDEWYIAPLEGKRATSIEMLQKIFSDLHIQKVHAFSNLRDAYAEALLKSQSGDRIVVFGSFRVVAEVMQNQRERMKA